ncbi:SCO-spondin-like [Mizuhopecten yessoensis]|uniref:SCO-spondin-like n=1 Tax=Mizuhopecten yessoensis TaxID=6573 RepID=UPI000B458F40|nr:SCO-spondin-like [Mizuhopecten yessoensis]
MGSVSVDTFLKWCREDVCAVSTQYKDDMFCEITAAMSMQCLLSNMNIDLDWNAYDPWSKKCVDYNECTSGTYTECSSICKGHCLDVQLNDQTCIEMCVPGCQCPDEGLFSPESNQLTCVNIEECPCYDPYTNGNVPANAVAVHGCTNCTCHNAVWDCENDNCDVEIVCPKNQIYKKGISGCTLTCETLDSKGRCESDVTYDGCGCPENHYKTPDGTCVTKENCPCKDNRNQYHMPNTEIEHSCKVYKCSNRKWVVIAEKNCPDVCWVSGGPHFRTFDNVDYNFDGDCTYVMAKSINLEDMVNFEVQITRLNCGISSMPCSRMVLFKMGSAKVKMVRGKAVEVDEKEVEASYYSFAIGKYQAHLSVEFPWTVLAIPDYQLSIMWDEGTRVYIFVGKLWKSHMDGLCGNYNKDTEDDLGGPASSGNLHANTYKTSSICADDSTTTFTPCEGHLSHRTKWAEEQCAVLNGELFERCRDEVAVEPYYDQCLYDACSTCIRGSFECEGQECALNCTDDQFSCTDGQSCIEKIFRCDSVMDCRDGSDETECVCEPGQFTCFNGVCINMTEKCDGMHDCLDGADEIGCPYHCEESTIEQFQCANGNCIPMSFRCDGNFDCHDDTSDEMNCNCKISS